MSTGNVLVPKAGIRSGNADSILAALWRQIIKDLGIDDVVIEDRIDRYSAEVTKDKPEARAQVRGNLRTDVGKDAMTWYTFTKCLRILDIRFLTIDFTLVQLYGKRVHRLELVLDDSFFEDTIRDDSEPNALSIFFAKVMHEQQVGVFKFEELLEIFVRRNRLNERSDQRTKFRGYLRKDFYSPKLSWANLIKGFVFLCTTKLQMTTYLTGARGDVTIHNYNPILSNKLEYENEVSHGRGL